MYEVIAFQNCSNWSEAQPTVKIDNKHSDWMSAYINWLLGKNPTTNSEWKKGVFAITMEVEG